MSLILELWVQVLGSTETREIGQEILWPRDLSKHPLLVGSRTLEKHVSAKCSEEEWQVGKNVSSRKAYPAIETFCSPERSFSLMH